MEHVDYHNILAIKKLPIHIFPGNIPYRGSSWVFTIMLLFLYGFKSLVLLLISQDALQMHVSTALVLHIYWALIVWCQQRWGKRRLKESLQLHWSLCCELCLIPGVWGFSLAPPLYRSFSLCSFRSLSKCYDASWATQWGHAASWINGQSEVGWCESWDRRGEGMERILMGEMGEADR